MKLNRQRLLACLALITSGVLFLSSGCDELITETREVTISGYPGANFVASTESCCRPCSVQFFDNSNGPRHTYVWDFGDGDSSTAKDPIHYYTTAGQFNVTLLIRDTINGNEDNEVKLNFVDITDSLNADFNAPIVNGCLPSSLQFFDNSFACNELVYVWDFGDGDSSSAEDPIHQYTIAGLFDVTLLVSDTVNGIDDFVTKLNFIQITDSLYADFSAPIDTCCLPCSLQFIDNSYAPCHVPVYIWDFGDGDSSSVKDPIHYYTTNGLFDVSLLIRDTITGNEDDSIKLNFVYIIDTLSDSANADFSIVPPTGDTSAIYAFTELTQGEFNTSFWDFGDGQSSTALSPSHNYDTAGVYLVRMILSSPCDSVEKIKTLTVSN